MTFLAAAVVSAEPPTVSEESTPIEEIVVTGTRLPKAALETPAAISVLSQDDIQLARPQLSIGESLGNLPGVFVQNRTNFAQDARISIRGFGARANFGLRGIKLIVDGIPATLPDGQGQVDGIDLASAERIEVLRGPSASLYGSSSGGVIQVVSEEGPETPFAQTRFNFGSYGFKSYAAKAGGQAGRWNVLSSIQYQEVDGYREHSAAQNLISNTKLRFTIDDASDVTAVLNFLHSPEGQDPGGLLEAEVLTDRRQANSRNVLYDAGEEVDQFQGGLTYRRNFGEDHETTARVFGVWRDFQNRLPFESGGAVHFDRIFAGGSLQHEWSTELGGHSNSLLGGLDIDAQRDHRMRRDNVLGVLGATTLDQDEDVTSVHLFVQDEFEILENLELSVGVAYGYIDYAVHDLFFSDGDDSGDAQFDEWSPMAALRYSPLPSLNLYTRFATSFEPPTTTELANPSGAGGFNPDLEAQRAYNFEVGGKGTLGSRASWEMAVFHIWLRNELVPYELLTQPGRSFFRNAGKSKRIGVELAGRVELLEGLRLTLAYTWSLFEFVEYETPDGNFDGNRTPGVPEHLVSTALEYQHVTGLFAAWELLFADEFFADDDNTVTSGPYTVSNLRFGWSGRLDHWELGPFVGINNLFGEKYNDNVRLNAGFGRYFEPAPERNYYGGIKVAYHFGD